MNTPTDHAITDAVLLEHVVEIVSAYLCTNAVSTTDLPGLITSTHSAMRSLPTALAERPAGDLKPAVPIEKSVRADFIICLEDGRKFKSMKRHLAGLGMTPDQYRAKWGLPSDYPIVAPDYAATRSALAKSAGLGRKTCACPSAGKADDEGEDLTRNKTKRRVMYGCPRQRKRIVERFGRVIGCGHVSGLWCGKY